MRVEYEKLFANSDELTDFLCKSNEEQDRILAELLAINKGIKSMEFSCRMPDKGIRD